MTAASTSPSGRPQLYAIVGSTGTGKSELSLDLAAQLERDGVRAEVVNADAMQLYRGMDIGTAKLSPSERRGVPHHLLDVLEVTDEASVADYQVRARAAIDEVLARGAVPILVGGSGLYVSSVIHDFRFPGTDPVIRARLEAELDVLGAGELSRRLRSLDPKAAAAVGEHNGRRIVRALEIIELTGNDHAASLPDEPVEWRPVAVVGLRVERPLLVERLNARVERMWAAGLVEEVESLLPRGLERGVTAGRAIGYAQAVAEVQGRMTREEAIAETQALTRRYARRQVSWFKRYRRARWYDAGALGLGARVRADTIEA